MLEAFEVWIGWARCGLRLIAVVTLAFGCFSAAAPQRSIALYQRLMAWVNWRVQPLDERRELRTTVMLGSLLVLFSVAALWLLRSPRR